MESNPYQSPNFDDESEHGAATSIKCPECGEPMETGYATTGARMYWRSWEDKSWLFSSAQGLSGTHVAFVGSNKLTGYRCGSCELLIVRYGKHKNSFAPPDR